MHYEAELFDHYTPVAFYGKLKEHYPSLVTMLFESAITSKEGNFSFITIGAKERITHHNDITTHYHDGEATVVNEHPFVWLQNHYKSIDQQAYKGLASRLGFSFVDGFIGMIGYDSVKLFEPTLKGAMEGLEDQLGIPDVDLVRPQIILAFSHKSAKLTLLQVDDEAKGLFEEIKSLLHSPITPEPIKKATLKEGNFSLTQEAFEKAVDEAKEHIYSGDIFQILLSNRYTQYGKIDPLSFYRLLRSKNPSPYLFLLNFENYSICGSSPEVMVRLQDNEILLRPIAGTRKRGETAAKDKELEIELKNDPKELSEHLMLIDLGRNDVGRVAQKGSVRVEEMMHIEHYSHVMHMVSDVTAQLDERYDMFDLFKATFTAGTMTGAPKIKAMELIATFEQSKRSFYSGAVGYFSFTGDMDSSIAIRTAYLDDEKIILHAGAGVVADSVPALEYKEVSNKLGALVATLEELGS